MYISKEQLQDALKELDKEIEAAERVILAAKSKKSVYLELLGEGIKPSEQPKKRTRTPSDKWNKVIDFIGINRKTADEILEFSESIGADISRSGLRGQMSNYRKKGIVAPQDGKEGYKLSIDYVQKYKKKSSDDEDVEAERDDYLMQSEKVREVFNLQH